MPTLSQRRQQILDEMARLDRLQRGYLSQQFFTRQRGGQTIRQGPYFVLQHAFKGKKAARRVPAEEVAAVKADLVAWRRFESLAEELAEVTEQMTLESRADADSKKNGRRSRGRGLRKRRSF